MLKAHQWDPNLKQEEIEELHAVTTTDDPESVRHAQRDLNLDSPYEEVRAAVRNTDGAEPANTLRAWILGLGLITVSSGLNMFLSMRNPPISFSQIVVLLLVYPMGNFWARVVPRKQFRTFGLQWTLNPGPFNVKEHTVIALMAGLSITYPYSTNAILALKGKPFYGVEMGWGFQLLFTLSSQLIGIGLAGLYRRFLVYPAPMIWPALFADTAVLNALHEDKNADVDPWQIGMYRSFSVLWYLMAAAFCYYWLPGVIWQGLTVFAFVTWIRPDDVTLNQLFGGYSGLSLIPLTFDWSIISSYLDSPLVAPVHTLFNTVIGLTVFVLVTTVGVVYSGAFFSDYLPISTTRTFDNRQRPYNVTRVLGPGFTFSLSKYKSYSPMFLAPTFALNYALSFASLTASLVHIVLFHRKEIWYRFKNPMDQEPDIRMRLMSRYPVCPDWWYAILLLASVAMGLVTVLVYPSQLPWWAFFLSFALGVCFLLPTGMILGIANVRLSLNILSPFIAGYMIPGRPVGVMLFKVYSTIILGQAQNFTMDLKLAHYMKIPQKTTFLCQVVSLAWASCVQIAVMNWTLGNIPNVCDPLQKNRFTCPNGSAFFSSSITWGLIGPKRMFGPGSMYGGLHLFWLVGAALPVVFYILMRRFPTSPLRFLNAPVMLGAFAYLPPANVLNYSTWVIVGLTFNVWIRTRWSAWWHKYNYVTAAALDSGMVLGTIVVFFAIVFPDVTVPQWWGNIKPFETIDYLNTAYRKTVAKGETFGPKTW